MVYFELLLLLITRSPPQGLTCLLWSCELACFLPISPHKTSPLSHYKQYLDQDSEARYLGAEEHTETSDQEKKYNPTNQY